MAYSLINIDSFIRSNDAKQLNMSNHYNSNTPTTIPPHELTRRSSLSSSIDDEDYAHVHVSHCNSNDSGCADGDTDVRTSASADEHDDIYAQLEQFEHSLDVEIESLEKLGFVETPNKATPAPTSSADIREQNNKQNHDINNSITEKCSSGDNDDECFKEEQQMTLMPPPSSWFQLDDQYIISKSSMTGEDETENLAAGQELHNMSTSYAQKDKSGMQQEKEDPPAINADASLSHDEQNQEQHAVHHPMEDSDYSLSYRVRREPPSSDTAHHEHKTDLLLPKYNSPEAHMFDLTSQTQMPVISPQHMMNEVDTDAVSQLTLPTTSSTLTPTTTANLSTLPLTISLQTLLTQSATTLTIMVSQTIPTLLQEYSTSALQKSIHKLRLEYARSGPKKYLRASDIGNCAGGYYVPPNFVHDIVGDADQTANDEDNHEYGNTAKNRGFSIQNSIAISKSATRDAHLDYMWATNGTQVRFTTLPWIERQLVHEWRTYDWTTSDGKRTLRFGSKGESSKDDTKEKMNSNSEAGGTTASGEQEQDVTQLYYNPIIDQDEDYEKTKNDDEDDEDEHSLSEYEEARTLIPRPLPSPQWENAPTCYACSALFAPSCHRHHCRRCGHSYCQKHSNLHHKLPHLGYDTEVPERVCKSCKMVLDARDLEERVLWRLARCRDFVDGDLTPYFETGVDTVEDAAYRLTRLAISLARSIPLGAQAYVAIETVEVIRKHGLKGVYGLLLRKEFLAAADLLCRVLGVNKKNWPLSVHELSAAIFYALAQHRALRGLRPDGEELIHSLKTSSSSCNDGGDNAVIKGSLHVVKEANTDNDSVDGSVEKEAGDGTMNTQPTDQNNDDEDAVDTIVWEGNDSQKYLNTGEFAPAVLDETDVYDPTSENVADLLAISSSPSRLSSSAKRLDKNEANCLEGKASDPNEQAYDDTPAKQQNTTSNTTRLPFDPVCEHVPDSLISSLLFYAPLALDFIYAECEVDMQLLAAQQGWRLVYASLDQNHHHANDHGISGKQDGGNKDHGIEDGNEQFSDKPVTALFAHDEHKIACLSIRGTATIHDVVTDIRAMPVPFPQQEDDAVESQDGSGEMHKTSSNQTLDEWTSVFRGNGVALCGMAGAASNLFRETADSLLYLALKGYKIRIVGHSLGGGVAALLGILVLRHFEKHCSADTSSTTENPKLDDGTSCIIEDGFVRVYSYGTPSCVDAKLADNPTTLKLVTSVVLHGEFLSITSIGLVCTLDWLSLNCFYNFFTDDVIPRLTPTSVRGLLKHLLYVRETWVKTHLSDDLNAITERAYHVWPTRLRGSFTLLKKKGVDSARRLKKTCNKRIKGQKSKPSSISAILDGYWDDSGNAHTSNDNITMNDDTSDAETYVSNDEGVDVEGDLFFDPLDDPINESDDESSVVAQHCPSLSNDADADWVPFDEPPMDTTELNHDPEPAAPKAELPTINENKQPTEPDSTPHILEEMPLPRLFIPGRIVHVYTHRGGYKAGKSGLHLLCQSTLSPAMSHTAFPSHCQHLYHANFVH